MSKRFLGLPFPLLIGLVIIVLGLFILGFLIGPLGQSIIGDLGLPGWLSVPRPHPELPAEVVFYILGFPVTNTIITAWISMAVLVVLSYLGTRRMKLVPGRFQGALEAAVGGLLSFCQNVAGEKNGRVFFSVVATIFLFVLANSWLSLLPGFGSILINNPEGHEVHLLRGANTDINMPLALALVSFVFVEYYGLKTLRLHYLGKFIAVQRLLVSLKHLARGRFKPAFSGLFSGVIDIFVGALEALSEFIRIVSFTFRLFGNMTAGEILLLIAAFLVPWVLSLPFYGLELLVGLIQALIFGGLTLVFATLAVAHHGE